MRLLTEKGENCVESKPAVRGITRRDLATLLPLSLSLRALAQERNPAVRPFRIDIPQQTIDHILQRVRETRFPERLDATDWSYELGLHEGAGNLLDHPL